MDGQDNWSSDTIFEKEVKFPPIKDIKNYSRNNKW